MGKVRYTKARLEMREVLTVRAPNPDSQPCSSCQTSVSALIRPDAAAAILGLSMRSVFRLLESGFIHFREVEHGGVLVCINSLIKCVGLQPQEPAINTQTDDADEP